MYLYILCLIFLFVIFLLIWFYWLQIGTKFGKMVNAFPGPPVMPIFGNFLEFETDLVKIFPTVRSHAKKFKNTYKLWYGVAGSVNIITPEDAEAVLGNVKHIEKSIFYHLGQNWLKTGLFTSSGKKWQTRRKLLTPSFHFNILVNFVDVFGDHCQKLVDRLKIECQKDKTNIAPIAATTTINIICETAMGTRLDCDGLDKDYVDSVYNLKECIIRRLTRPWLLWDFTYKFTWEAYEERKYLNVVHKFTENVIKEREKNFKATDFENIENNNGFKAKKRLAMLDLLMDCKRRDQIDDDGIKEEVDTFMFGGFDTTALTLTYALMFLANHEDVQEKVYKECRKIFSESKRKASYDDLKNMEYLGRVIKETLRHYPPFPFISRKISQDVVLSNGVAPAGCIVNIHIYDVLHNPDIYPDPDKFDPDRFLPENSVGKHPFSYIAFSAGPRNCIGQKYALLELKSLISTIVRNFVLRPVTLSKDLRVDLIMRSCSPVYIKFEERV